ncbi:hypothetical protein [Paenibacillus illinoisensis]|uniref:hypothetical protein n=1 Tax=Paenibacillus illinoisensis TaxID=59845 RepID=UPI00301C78F8
MTAGDNWYERNWIRGSDRKTNESRSGNTYILQFRNLGLFITSPPHHSKETVIRVNGAEGTELDQKKRSVRVYLWIFPL